MNIPDWFYDERVQQIAPEKLTLLLRQNLGFTREEFELIFRIMKEGKSDAEKAQMDEMLNRAHRLFSAQSQKGR